MPSGLAGLCLQLPVPLLVVAMGGMFVGKHLPWLELLLAAPVCLWGGYPFFQRAWRSLQTGNLNMFTLIGLGTGVSWVYSTVAALTPGCDAVHKISIIPRGLAALGYTQQRPTEDRYLMSQNELLAKIDVLLGGRVAEKIMFQDVTTGAHNDLQRATDIAKAMVAEYGMGKTLGLSTYPRNPGPGFLGQSAFGATREYSEETAACLDQEVRQILDQRETRVTGLINDKKETLIAVAKRLLEKEVLMEDEFMAMVDVGKKEDGGE